MKIRVSPFLLKPSSGCNSRIFRHTIDTLRLSTRSRLSISFYRIHHHHKHQGLDPLIRSVSRVTAARANASSAFQLFSFLVVCSGMISKGFGFVAFFASVKAISVCIHLSCLVCLQSAVRSVCSHLFCGHRGCSLPEVSVTSFCRFNSSSL